MTEERQKKVKALMAQMTLREKIGQTLLVRQSDLLLRADKDYKEARGEEEAAMLMEQCQFGGIWTHGNMDVNGIKDSLDNSFSFTSETYTQWLAQVTAKAKCPVICANDAGGSACFTDLSPVTLGLVVGAADDEELTRQIGYNLAREHAFAGHHWIWSPMVDLCGPYVADITRPFAGDQDCLIRHSKAFIKGMQEAGVAACAKHYPGADPKDSRDSHVVTTDLEMDLEEWEATQGRVFQEMIDAGVYTIMSAAQTFPAVDDARINGRYVPASFSQKILMDLLKGKMGFKGAVITDDVNMGGYTSYYSHEELYGELLRAGNDVLLGVGVDALELIEKSVEQGRLSVERVEDACLRVLELKAKLGLLDDVERKSEGTLKEAKEATAKTLQQVSEKSVTMLWDRYGQFPVKKEQIKKVTIIMYSHAQWILKSLEHMKRSFEKRGACVELRNKLESITEARQVAEESDLIVYAGYIGHFAPKGAPCFFEDVFWSLRYAFTEGVEKSVAVSLGYPYIHYDFMADAPAFFNLYRPSAQMQEAFVGVLYGELPAVGKSPVDLNAKKRGRL